MHHFIKALEASSQASETAMSVKEAIYLLTNSVMLGFVLVAATFLITLSLGKNDVDTKKNDVKDIIASSNLLLLTVGMTGVMLLIDNNLVRAFAIVSALALVRFRVKLGRNELSAVYLFAVLAGMAAGLNELVVAWTTTAFFAGLILLLNGAIRLTRLFESSNPTAVSSKTQSKVDALNPK